MKVGLDVKKDKERLAFIRNAIGEDSLLMLDANQIWGVEEAISHMLQLVEFKPYWIEEPTARDDVLGYQRIGAALKPYVGLAVSKHPLRYFQAATTTGADLLPDRCNKTLW